jgi:hypothetical protein
MGKGRVTETERMLNLVVGNTEQAGGGKLKNWKGFSKPNFGLVPLFVKVVVASIYAATSTARSLSGHKAGMT